jgi:hypothetical protein
LFQSESVVFAESGDLWRSMLDLSSAVVEPRVRVADTSDPAVCSVAIAAPRSGGAGLASARSDDAARGRGDRGWMCRVVHGRRGLAHSAARVHLCSLPMLVDLDATFEKVNCLY